MDPNMMAALMQQGGGAPAPAPDMAMGGGMPAGPHMMPDGTMMGGDEMGMMPPPNDVSGPMALMNQPEMNFGGDSLMALAEFADDPDVAALLRKQDEERRGVIDSLQRESAMAAEALLSRMRMFGESIDTPGGPISGMA